MSAIRPYKFDPVKIPSYLDSIEDHDKYFLVRLKGNLDRTVLERNVPKMTKVIEEVDLYSKSIVCDFGQVNFTDTATVAALVKRFADFRKRGANKMVFFNIPLQLKTIMEVAKLSELFQTRATFEDAVRALEEESPR